ncbi:cation:proton antiporter [Nitratifractor sp.]
MDNLLTIILTTVAIATLLNLLLQRFEIPTVIGYILSGALISQIFGLNHSNHNEALHQLGEFGIVFLMFTIGLEFSVRHLRKMRREVFLFGGLQVLLTGNIFGAIAHQILGFELKSAIIIGFSLALSSTAIVLKMLTERNEIHSGFGRVTLGVLLMQDIAVIPILLMLTLFSSPDRSVGEMMLWTFLDASLLLAFVFVLGRWMLEPFLVWTLSSDSEEIFLVAALTIVVGISYVGHLLGFSYSLGAFLAGMALSETRFKYRIEADLLSFRDIFLGIFFVTVGMQIEPITLLNHWMMIPLLLVGVMLAKGAVLFAILSPFLQYRTAFKSALALMEVGEFALAIYAIAAQNRLLDPETTQILIVTVVLSMILTPFIINHLKSIADRVFAVEPETDLAIISSGYRDHVLLIGYGILGKKLAQKLRRLSIPYLILEHDYKLVKEAEAANEPILLANAAAESVLKAVDIDKAMAVIVAIENPAKTRMVVDAVTRVAPQVTTVVAVRNASQMEIIETFPVDCVINTSDLVSEAILDAILRCRIDRPGDGREERIKNSL